jgi:hypothetical protein
MVGVTTFGALRHLERPLGEMMSLLVNADCDNNAKDNGRLYDVEPQCTLRESENDIRCRHNFTQ